MTRFGKLGGKAGLTEKIYSSSQNVNYIHMTVLSLSSHGPSGKSIYFKDFLFEKRKTGITLFSFGMFTRSVDPERKLFQIESSQEG